MAVTSQQIKDTFDEFDSLSDTVIGLAIAQAARLVNETQWGTTRSDDGVLYLACHILKLLTEGDALAPSAVTSESVARVSTGYQQVGAGADSWLAGTAYGRHYLFLAGLVFPDRVLP